MLNDLQYVTSMHLNIQFIFICPFRLVKLPLGLAAHPPTL